jgi:Tol biopolymer transport system component
LSGENQKGDFTMQCKKTILSVILIFMIVLFFAAFSNQNSPEHKVLFEKAKYTMETKGDLKGAIELFEEIIRKYPDERRFAAESQYYIGACYEKLGLGQAKAAFQKAIEEYPGQTQVVGLARKKLLALSQFQTAPQKSEGEFKIRKVWSGNRESSPSYNGRYIAYADWDSRNGDVAISDLVTGKTSHLTHDATRSEFAETCVVSPDGRKVAYSWYNNDEFYELRIVGIDGSKPRILYRDKNGEDIWPHDWSSDGKHILAFYRGICIVDVEDGSVQELIRPKRNKIETMFRGPNMFLSPDGRYIAFDIIQKKVPQIHDIHMIAVDGSYEVPLVEHPADDNICGWTPDGKSLLYKSDRTGSWSIWLLPIKGNKPAGTAKLIQRDVGEIKPLGFSQNGGFYFSRGGWSFDVYSAGLDLTKGKLLDPPTKYIQRYMGSNRSPAWSADGKYLAYISAKKPPPSDRFVLRIRTVETGAERELLLDLPWFNFIQWFPDGHSIKVFGAHADRKMAHYRVDVKTGELTSILQKPGTQIRSAAVGPDGSTLYYCSNNWRKQLYQVLAKDLNTGREKEIWRGTKESGAISLAISPDGHQLALRLWLSSEDEDPPTSLNTLPLSGGELQELVRFEGSPSVGDFVWTPDSKQILFIKKFPRRSEIWLIPASGGPPKNLNFELQSIDHIRIHPDGQTIAFSSYEYNADIWVMENFLPEK